MNPKYGQPQALVIGFIDPAGFSAGRMGTIFRPEAVRSISRSTC